MSRIRRRLVVAVSATLLGIGITVPYATPSYAAGCYGTGCTGKDPQANCSESPITTLESRTLRGVGGSPYSIQLRYSPTCLAFWARGIREDCAILQTLWVHIAEEQQKSIILDGERTWVTSRVQRSQVHPVLQPRRGSLRCLDGGTGWTPMNPDENDRHRACIWWTFSEEPPAPPFDGPGCTNWYY